MDKKYNLKAHMKNAKITKIPTFRPPPPDVRTFAEKKKDRELQNIEDEKKAKELIEEGRDRMFNMSFEKQQMEHEWNVEEYEKGRIESYENEFPYNELYEGVAQWCICYKCRPDFHSQPGGVIYLANEKKKAFSEHHKMFREDSSREKKRIKLEEIEVRAKKIARRQLREDKKRKEKEEEEKIKKEEFHKKMQLEEMNYRAYLIKEKTEERDKLLVSQGWKKGISTSIGKTFWSNGVKSLWENDIHVEYDEWLEFYSHKNNKPFWYNHRTKSRTWCNPKSL